jgi:hypothetical protein
MYIEQVLGNTLMADNTNLSIAQSAVQQEKVQVQDQGQIQDQDQVQIQGPQPDPMN